MRVPLPGWPALLRGLLISCFLVLLAGQAHAQAMATSHSAVVKADGTLWAWGRNQYGQLGDGTVGDKVTPVQVGTGRAWRSVAVGSYHTVALRQDGTLWTWGHNRFGQLGNGTSLGQTTPQQIGTATTWLKVSAGGTHTVALKSDGTLWTWGYNGLGQLGDGAASSGRDTPAQVGTSAGWQSVSAGWNSTLALRTDGTLWAWGDNQYGQLGAPKFSVEPLLLFAGMALPVRAAAPGAAAGLQLTAWPTRFGAAGPRLRVTAPPAGPLTLSVVDATGRVRLQRQLPGSAELGWSAAAALPAGVYLLRVQQGRQRASVRLVRE
ncbi:hypothetical protein [Hymenobacter edaphi]|uniref:RCC1-like domain-containing protein n=1 Tax=Hymenobacter edaphi TaxID=2211146 RepID=A0A328BSE7_9BACT|nr:hypothetical protein [Hymenobacter edaphi]RAK69491.1 hypothetical protein DLM85_01105 [Hymenobacter edaphi]